MTTPKRSALGRGLGALIPGAARERSVEPEVAAGAGREVRRERIADRSHPPESGTAAPPLRSRRTRASRRLDPPARRPAARRRARRRERLRSSSASDAGERRGRRPTTIPAVVADIEPRDRLEIALVENVQRHDLNPIELALAFRALAESGATQESIGERVALRALHDREPPAPARAAARAAADVECGAMSVGHAKAILAVASPERRRSLRDRIVGDALSVRQAEELARGLGAATRAPARARISTLDPDLANLVDMLRQRVQTQVRLRGSASRGRIEIDYVGADELNRLVDLILGEP